MIEVGDIKRNKIATDKQIVESVLMSEWCVQVGGEGEGEGLRDKNNSYYNVSQ